MTLLGLAFPVTFTGQLPVNSRSRHSPVITCSNERRILFSRIAPVYDNVWSKSLLFVLATFHLAFPDKNRRLGLAVEWSLKLGSASDLEAHGCLMERVRVYISMCMFCVYLLFLSFSDFGSFIWKTSAKTGDYVLDLCCGSGDLAFLLSEKVGSNGKVCLLEMWLLYYICLLWKLLFDNLLITIGDGSGFLLWTASCCII